MNLLETRIDLDAIAANTRYLKALVSPAKLMCVVKADGYNHGAVPVAKTMQANGADMFGVATISEARELRANGINAPILAWIWSPRQDWQQVLAEDITLACATLEQIRTLATRRVATYLKVDTGLHRSGIEQSQWAEAMELLAHSELEVRGLCSHFACADEPEHPFNQQQMDRFAEAIELARSYGLAVEENHIANSPATLALPQAHLDMVRPGLALYGLAPFAECEHPLVPAMSWVARVSVVKQIKAGDGSSYGLTWTAPRDGYIAVVSAGYADGVPRAWQERFTVSINGQEYPQVGRICMDQFVVFLGDNDADISLGDEAVIFGAGGQSATALAARVGTINYEVVCRPTGRTVRVYQGTDL